jgi:hypothetical protein
VTGSTSHCGMWRECWHSVLCGQGTPALRMNSIRISVDGLNSKAAEFPEDNSAFARDWFASNRHRNQRSTTQPNVQYLESFAINKNAVG